MGFSRQQHWSGLPFSSLYTHTHTHTHISIPATDETMKKCLSIDGHLGCFCILAIVNNAAMNTGSHVCFQISGLVFFRCILRCGSPESYDSCVSNLFEECPYCFPQWLHLFTFPPILNKGSLSSYLHKHLLFVVFLMMDILTECHCGSNLHLSDD